MAARAAEPIRQSVTEIMIVPTIVISEYHSDSDTASPLQATSGLRASKGLVGMQLTIFVSHDGGKLNVDSRVVSTSVPPGSQAVSQLTKPPDSTSFKHGSHRKHP